MLGTQCPLCGGTLVYSQNADITYKVIFNKKLEQVIIPILDKSKISWCDATTLFCEDCGSSDYESSLINSIKREYDNHDC
jgi:hypothetical protein